MTETSDCVILVVEDNSADVALVQEALKEYQVGCAVHVLKDGAQAIAFLNNIDTDPAQPRLDLVLLDLHLPKRDGEEILRRLRSTGGYAKTPVIVMTGSDSPSDQQNAKKNAAVSYFKKPTSLAEFMQLGAIVRSVLGGNGENKSTRNNMGGAV